MLKNKPYKICVFCGSKNGNSNKYILLANKLGAELAKKKFTLIFGGGRLGLMGALSRSFYENNENLISIAPKYFKDKNILTKIPGKLIWTNSIAERKSLMIKLADLFIALPGGYGTLDEIIEVISLNQLNIVNKNIILIDVNNFWKPLKLLIKDLKNQGFLYNSNTNNIIYKNSVNKTIEFIENNL